jgi:hypothetical protein
MAERKRRCVVHGLKLRFLPLFLTGLTAAACTGAAAPGRDNSTTAAAAVGASADSTSTRTTGSVRHVTLPAGTQLPLVLDTSVGSDISRVEQPVQAHLAQPVMVSGTTALAEGSTVTGVVTDATQSGKIKGRAHVSLRFDTVVPSRAAGDAEHYRIDATPVGRTAASTTKRDAEEIGLPAVGGAIVGGIVGGGKGAAIGAAAGGGAGTAVVLNQRGKEVRLGRGARLTVKLVEPLTVTVPE